MAFSPPWSQSLIVIMSLTPTRDACTATPSDRNLAKVRERDSGLRPSCPAINVLSYGRGTSQQAALHRGEGSESSLITGSTLAEYWSSLCTLARAACFRTAPLSKKSARTNCCRKENGPDANPGQGPMEVQIHHDALRTRYGGNHNAKSAISVR